jgi:hypothetical protein
MLIFNYHARGMSAAYPQPSMTEHKEAQPTSAKVPHASETVLRKMLREPGRHLAARNTHAPIPGDIQCEIAFSFSRLGRTEFEDSHRPSHFEP